MLVPPEDPPVLDPPVLVPPDDPPVLVPPELVPDPLGAADEVPPELPESLEVEEPLEPEAADWVPPDADGRSGRVAVCEASFRMRSSLSSEYRPASSPASRLLST